MNIISWNISYSSNKEKIAEILRNELLNNDTIICLMEVVPKTFEYFKMTLGEQYGISYSLDYRKPGKYDSKSRMLGIVFVYPKKLEINEVDVLWRTPFPDRTLMMKYKDFDGLSRTIITLHSITGCDYKKAKSVQFNSFAECIDNLNPDYVTFDANEPCEDAFHVDDMVFFDNKDKGAAARNFFTSLVNNGLADSFVLTHNENDFIGCNPLTVSHKIHNRISKRYDFIFVKKDQSLYSCDYCYEKAIEASSDHAYLKIQFKK